MVRSQDVKAANEAGWDVGRYVLRSGSRVVTSDLGFYREWEKV